MVIVCFNVKNKDDAAASALAGFVYRASQGPDVVKRPFKARLSIGAEGFYTLDIEPLWPRLGLWGLMLGSFAFLSGWFWTGLALVVVGCFLELFWLPSFYILLLKVMVKKAGSRASVEFLPLGDALGVAVFGTDRGV